MDKEKLDFSNLPLHQFHNNEVTPVSGVEQHQAVRCCGFELKEQVHGGVSL